MIRLFFALSYFGLTIAHADGPVPRAPDASLDPSAIYDIPLGDAPVTGPADAPITIVEWSDYACGYCGRVQDTLDRLDRLYPGLLRMVHRGLPLDAEDTIALELARAAHAQGRFRPMHATLFALHGRVDRARAEVIGQALALDVLALRRDLDEGAHKAAISADVEAAARLGISGTPTFLINGRPVLGNQPLAVFVDVVEEELVRARVVAETAVAAGRGSSEERARRELDPQAIYRVGLGLPGHQRGPNDALVTIVVWSDFQCPFCARLERVLAQVRAKYKDQVRIAFRHMPLAAHPAAALAAEAAVAAAAQGTFWPFHDQVFARFGHLTRADLESFAKAAKLDLTAFRAALDERRYRDVVIVEAAAAAALGVDGTPTTFINGLPVVGARTFAAMDAIVAAQLARARTAIARGVAPGDIYALAMDGARGEERADPSTIPGPTVGRLELRAEDRVRAVAAACRFRDRKRAVKLAEMLSGGVKVRANAVCTGVGIDLP